MPSPAIIGRPHHLPRILVLTCLGVVMAVAVAVTLAILFQRQETIHHSEDQLKQLTTVMAEQAERTFESADLVLETTVSRIESYPPGDPGAYSAIQGYLSRQSQGIAPLASVLVLDANGDLLIDSESAVPRRYNGSDRPAFQYFRDGGTDLVRISEPVRSRLTGRWLLVMSRRIDDPDGVFAGVVLAAVDLTYFADFYGAIGLGHEGLASWLRTDGVTLLQHPFDETLLGRSAADSRVLRAFRAQLHMGIVREVSPWDGVDRLLAYRSLRSHPVLVVAGHSMDTILEPWRRFAVVLAGIGLIAITILAGISAVLVRLARREEVLLADAEQARAEAELASKAAERASRAKSEFLAGVSHDLRTPLNSIIGFSEVLIGGMSGSLSDRQREYIQYISTAGTHLLSLINNLLDLAKIEANRLTILDDNFSLYRVINECMRLVGAQAGAGRVVLFPYDERDIGLRADPVRIRQIIFNLLSNAIKFTPPGGSVAVRSTRAENGSLAISVSDTGIGMSGEEIATAMQPYGQVTNKYTRDHEGTGLGLPLVRTLAEMHGGRLEISSTPGKGTTVTVIVPASRVLSADSETQAA